MAWTDITREQHKRAGLRYPSDLTDSEWALIALAAMLAMGAIVRMRII